MFEPADPGRPEFVHRPFVGLSVRGVPTDAPVTTARPKPTPETDSEPNEPDATSRQLSGLVAR